MTGNRIAAEEYRQRQRQSVEDLQQAIQNLEQKIHDFAHKTEDLGQELQSLSRENGALKERIKDPTRADSDARTKKTKKKPLSLGL